MHLPAVHQRIRQKRYNPGLHHVHKIVTPNNKQYTRIIYLILPNQERKAFKCKIYISFLFQLSKFS